MLKKLEIDALEAELANVDVLLSERTLESDPIGHLQFSARRQELAGKLSLLGSRPESHAEIGIFFGGRPVQGSRGINADFAGKALDDLQSLVSKRYVGREGVQLGARGRVPSSDQAQLLVTGAVRGSFGFVLEEAGDNEQIVDSSLKEVVEEVSELLSSVAASDEFAFDIAASSLDERILVTLKQFFKRLDENGATVRIVQGDRDFLLDRQAVSLARERTQAMEVHESGDTYTGQLFLLPDSKRFDFFTEVKGQRTVIKGTVSPVVMRQISGQASINEPAVDLRRLSSRAWTVEIKTREIRERNRSPRAVHTLMRVIGSAPPQTVRA